MKDILVVKSLLDNSIAKNLGIEEGDIILKINGSDVFDTLEYRYLTADDKLNIDVKKKDGRIIKFYVEKDFYDDLGIEFDDNFINSPKHCSNKCIFCFIDQLPEGMRETLYFKDDDSRLSFLNGNFVTLTNMKDEDLDRIIRFKISPINVSVHTTNSDLRISMLNNKRAGNIMEQLKRLTDGGININCQIVLCPKINDGEELINTINDLFTFYPRIQNVAVVPVGITKYRRNFIESFDGETSKKVIDSVNSLQVKFYEKIDEPFVRLSDEFYLLSREELPSYEHYGDFEQLEDGIGMTRYIENRIREDLDDINIDGHGRKFAVLTGILPYFYIKGITELINSSFNININVYPVENKFFGEKITVAGLLTGRDIINCLKGKIKEEVLFIPSNMLKADEDVFLDDISLSDIEKALNVRIIVLKYTGDDLVEKITKEVIEWQNQ